MPSDNTLDPRITAAGKTSVLDAKIQQTLEKSAQKKAQLAGEQDLNERLRASFRSEPVDMISSAEINARTAIRRKEEARLTDDAYGRTVSDITGDTVRNLAGTTTGIATGLVSLGIEAVRKSDPSKMIGDIQEEYGYAPMEETTYSRMLRDAAQKASNFGGKIQRNLKEKNSWQSRLRAEDADAAQAADEAAHQAIVAADIEAGRNATLAEARGFARDIGSAVKNTAKNPGHLVDTVVEQLPSLAGGFAVRGGMTAASIQARALAIAESRGLKAVTKEITEEAVHELGKLPFMVSTGLMEGGGAYSEAVNQIMEMPLDQLVQQYPGIAEALQTTDETEVRAALADDVANKAAALQGVAAAGIGRIASRFELNPAAVLTKLPANMLREGVEEGLQGASGQLSQNYAQITSGDEQTTIGDGVGTAIGQSAIAGLGMPVVTQAAGSAVDATLAAPGVALAALKGVAPVVGKTIQAAGNALEARADRKRKEAEAPAKAKAAAEVLDGTDKLRENLALGGTVLDLDGALEKLSPAMRENLAKTGPEVVDQIGAFAHILNMTEQADAPDGVMDEAVPYLLFADHKLADLVRITDTKLETEEDPVKIEALTIVRSKAKQLRENPQMGNIRALASSNEYLHDIAEKVDTLAQQMAQQLPLDPKLKEAAETVRSLISLGLSSELSSDTITKTQTLYSRELDPLQSFNFDQARKLAVIREENEEAIANRKTIKQVGTEMVSTGFQLNNKKLRSMKDFTSEILGLSAAGANGSTKKAAKVFHDWARHQTERAASVEKFAQAQILEFSQSGNWISKNLPFRTLDTEDDTKLSVDGKKQFVNLEFAGSHEFANAVYEDAKALVDTYNTVRESIPERFRPPALPEVAQPTWQAAYAATGATPRQAKARVSEQAATSTPQVQAPTNGSTKEEVDEVGAAAESTAPQAQVETPKEATPEVTSEGGETEAAPAPVIDYSTMTPEQMIVMSNGLLGENEPDVDFENTKDLASAQELKDVTDLSNEDYLKLVNPDGVVTADTPDKRIRAELRGTTVSKDATVIGRVEDTEIDLVAYGNYLYAIDRAAPGEPVVGMLYHKKGTSLMVSPDTNYRKKGIGKALLRELLIRKPTAKTSGLSKAAVAVRLSVLNTLRQEQHVPIAESMEERFPGLAPLADTPTVVDGFLTRNRFLSAFTLNNRSLSLFAQHLSPVSLMRTALGKGVNAVMKLIPAEARYGLKELDSDTMQGLQRVFGKHLTDVSNILDKNLDTKMKERSKQWGTEKGKALMWNVSELLSLHVMVEKTDDNGEVSYEYHPQVRDAMALTGLRWAVDAKNTPYRYDEEQVQKLFPDNRIPNVLIPFFQDQKVYTQDIQDLSRDLSTTLGLNKNADASVTSNSGLMDALAKDIFAAFSDQKQNDRVLGNSWVQLSRMSVKEISASMNAELAERFNNNVPKRDQEELDKYLSELPEGDFIFRKFPDDDTENNITYPLNTLSTLFGDTSEWLDALTTAGARDRAHVGFSPKTRVTKVKGTGGALGTLQAAMLRKLDAIKFTLNDVFDEELYSFEPAERFRLFDGVVYDEENGNVGHMRLLRGKKSTAIYTMQGIHSLRLRTKRYAETAGIDRKDVPLSWTWRITAAGRADMQGFSPQASKWLRELYTTSRRVVDLTNPTHVRDFWLSLAQALDVKVETQLHDEAIAKVKEKLNDPQQLGSLLEKFADVKGNANKEFVDEFLGKKFGNKARAFNALSTYARFLKMEPGETKFTSHLAFEIDGKTDGVINAIMQFGLRHLDARLLRQLAQGGLFLGRAEKNTLNENPGQGDFYINSGIGYMDAFKKMAESQPPNVRNQLRHTFVALKRKSVGLIEVKNDRLEPSRNAFKNPSTQKVYGASDMAITRGMGKKIEADYLNQLHEAVLKNELLDPELIQEIKILLGSKIVAAKGDTPAKIVPVYVMPLNTIADYKAFDVTSANSEAMQSNIDAGAGAALTERINDELSSTEHATTDIVTSTVLLASAAASVFRRMYDKRRSELVAAGVLASHDGLSQNEENKIMAAIEDLLPVFQTAQTEGGGGIRVAETELKGSLPVLAGKKGRNATGKSAGTVQTTGISGMFASDINARSIDPNPGVRVLALLNQAAGDGAMMGQVAQILGNWLNVYDGAEMGVGDLNAGSLAANEAVYNNWNYPVVGKIVEKLNTFKFDFNKLTPEEQVAALKNLRVDKEVQETLLAQPSEIGEYLNLTFDGVFNNLQTVAIETAAVRTAMNELNWGVDHMAGVMLPYTKEGKTFETQEEVLAYLQDRVAEILGYTPSTFAEASDVRAAMDMALLNGTNKTAVAEEKPTVVMEDKTEEAVSSDASVLSGKQLRAILDKHKFQNKVAGYVYRTIRGMIPDDLKIYRGTPEQLQATQARLYPGHNVDTRAEGSYLNGVLFLREDLKGLRKETTLVHELIHATTYGIVKDFYNNGGKRITPMQREAVRNLETLAEHALAMTEDGVHESALTTFREFKQILRDLKEANNPGAMVEELMAYVLTSPYVKLAVETKTGPLQIRVITKKLLESLRRMFGLPNNPPMEDFFNQTLGQMKRLTVRPVADTGIAEGNQALYNMLAEPGSDIDPRLDALMTSLDAVLATLPNKAGAIVTANRGGKTPYTDFEAQAIKAQVEASFFNAGFSMTPQQLQVVGSVHAVMTTMNILNPLAMDELQQAHEQVMKTLEPSDLLDDPDNNGEAQMNLATRKFDMLRTSTGRDRYGRSSLLTNFVALALVDPGLRRKMQATIMSKGKFDGTSADAALRSGAQLAMDLLGDTAMKVRGKSQEAVLDDMVRKILVVNKQATVTSNIGQVLVERAEAAARKGINSLNTRTQAAVDALPATNPGTNAGMKLLHATRAAVTHGLNVLSAPESKAPALAKVTTMMLNQSGAPALLKEIARDLMGTTDENRMVHRLLNEAKQRVAQIRQRLREQVPSMIQKFFTKPLTKKTMQVLHRSIGQTDLQTLVDVLAPARLAEVLRDPAARAQEVAKLLAQLPTDTAAALQNKASSLGRYMMSKDTAGGELFLARNAEAIVLRTMVETDKIIRDVVGVSKTVDQLTSLYALDWVSDVDKAATAHLLETEADGMVKVMRLLGELVSTEFDKHREGGHRINAWKGFIPTSTDPRVDFAIAGPKEGAELLKRGYKMTRFYEGDARDPSNGQLSYYSTNWSGGQSTYNQGALQTVESSLSGIDALTGRTLDPAAKMMITDPDTVDDITAAKMQSLKRSRSTGYGPQLLPIFNARGEVIAYERPVDPVILAQYNKSTGHLADAIGSWMGRQAEESMAVQLNTKVIETLHEQYLADKKEGRVTKEYVRVDINKSKVIKDIWDSVPRQTQEEFVEVFGGAVWIREDMLDNSVGYRGASVGDIFTGTSNLSPDTRKALENIAFALAGKSAYPILVTAERAWQGAIGTVKDIIVVRSGVVAIANLLSNQVQLLQMTGWNPARLLRVQLAAARELDHYQRNQTELTKLNLLRGSTVDKVELSKIDAAQQRLRDANKRFSITPLLEAGMLPTIAEGLSEQDQHTLLHDSMRWVEDKASALPQGFITAAKYAMITKDTALYQGMNRMVQFGDFMAKAALYQAMMEKNPSATRNSEAEALILDEVNESFVNYNLLAGRNRDYLESMGVTWFWNYKLRIQKIALRNFKRNPLQFMGMGSAAEMAGLDSLLTSSAPALNWGYSVGPAQLTRGYNMLLWRSAF